MDTISLECRVTQNSGCLKLYRMYQSVEPWNNLQIYSTFLQIWEISFSRVVQSRKIFLTVNSSIYPFHSLSWSSCILHNILNKIYRLQWLELLEQTGYNDQTCLLQRKNPYLPSDSFTMSSTLLCTPNQDNHIRHSFSEVIIFKSCSKFFS